MKMNPPDEGWGIRGDIVRVEYRGEAWRVFEFVGYESRSPVLVFHRVGGDEIRELAEFPALWFMLEPERLMELLPPAGR